MPSKAYYRSQAHLFACLAVASSDPQIAERYNQMALEQLARAEEVEPAAGKAPHGSDDRDAEPPGENAG